MTTPATRVPDADQIAYQRDGVVCLRGALASSAVNSLASIWDATDSYAMPARHVSVRAPELRAALIRSEIPALVGRLIGARSIGFYWDQIFEKPVGSAKPTPWHHDAGSWPLAGEQIVGVWLALTAASPANGLECIAGSHRFPYLYWDGTARGRSLERPPDRPFCPDFELRRGDPQLEFLHWDMEPGDALVIHPRTVHFSPGNRSGRRRLAYVTWWHGDDVSWDPRPECEPLPTGIDPATVRRGDRPTGESVPIVWRKEAL